MVVTVNYYDNFILRTGAGDIDLDTDTHTIILMSTAHSYVSSHVRRAQVSAQQISSGNGYGLDLENLLSVTWTESSGDATFDAADAVWTASGGSITARHAVLYDNTTSTASGNPNTDELICSIDFGQVESAGDATDFRITWNTAGIFRIQ